MWIFKLLQIVFLLIHEVNNIQHRMKFALFVIAALITLAGVVYSVPVGLNLAGGLTSSSAGEQVNGDARFEYSNGDRFDEFGDGRGEFTAGQSRDARP